MKKYILVLIMLITTILLTGCKKANEKEIELDINEIKAIKTITKDNELLLTIKNPYKENINIEVTITYYDSKENEIDFDYDFVECISSGETVYLGFDLIDDNYSDYKIEIVPKINPRLKNKKDKIKFKTTKNNKNLEVELINQGEETIDIVNIIVLYYKNELIIGYDIAASVNLEPNKTNKVKLYPPYQGDKVLNYDRYDIKINEAYTE